MAYSSGYSSTRARGRSAPLGIKIICALGGIGAIRTSLEGLSALGVGGPFALAGILLLAFGLGRLVVLYGLWTLQSWAWGWALLLYGASALASLVRFDLLGTVLALIVVGYIASKERHYR